MAQLTGKVALVTGATRGIGKGIALALGEAGATVYITGRSLDTSTAEVGGSLAETQAAIATAGGQCIPVQVDHQDDHQVQSLFDRIQAEQGQLDVLVNNAYSGVQALRETHGKPFWESDLSLWDACNNVGLRSHYIASVLAARLMTPRQQGLICTISSWGGLAYLFGVPYGVGKSACDRLAADMAKELKPYQVASVCLYPGIVGTELFSQLVTDLDGAPSLDPALTSIQQRYNWETPLLTGRVIAALAADPTVMRRTGRVQIVAELAKQYGLVDENGRCPASLRSLRFMVPYAIPALRPYAALLPDVKIPWSLLLLTALSAPKI